MRTFKLIVYAVLVAVVLTIAIKSLSYGNWIGGFITGPLLLWFFIDKWFKALESK